MESKVEDISELDSSEFDENQEDEDLESTLTKTVLKLEEIDVNLFRSTSLWKPRESRSVFGGQVVGQALVAASLTKSEGFHVHSLHCYFIRGGKPNLPIVYHVDATRNGKSFATRIVNAVQHGESILSMLVSFHATEESPVSHQYKMPEVTPPDQLLTFQELLKLYISRDQVPEKHRVRIQGYLDERAQELPIEVKPVDPFKFGRLRRFLGKEGLEPKSLVWIKARGRIGDKENNLHRCAAAYFSDWTLLSTTLLPVPHFRPKMMASLDHSMWFHSHFRADEWMLYECESPRMIGGRALVLGRLWKQDGTLAVSVAQEGVVRGILTNKL